MSGMHTQPQAVDTWSELARFAGAVDPGHPHKIRGSFSFIDVDATVGERTIISPFCYIGPNVRIGADCYIGPGSVIGSPGFGYTREEDGSWSYRTHPHGVVIGDNVHIGANTCVDAGRHRPTKIGSGSRIDNLVHIAHNVEVGEDCLVIACSEVSGSCEIGDGAVLSPGATVRDWRNIGAGAQVGLGAVVVKDVPPGEVWAGNPARQFTSPLGEPTETRGVVSRGLDG